MAPPASPRPTFVFQNDRAYAFVRGQVVASAATIEELHEKLAFGEQFPTEVGPDGLPYSPNGMAGDHADPNGQGPAAMDPAVEARARELEAQGIDYHQALVQAQEEAADPYQHSNEPPGLPEVGQAMQPDAQIVTPGGLTGRVLGTTKDIWDREEITVRLENGHIAHLRVGEFSRVAAQKTASVAVVDSFKSRLAASTPVDSASLKARIVELRALRAEASAAVATANEADAAALDSVIVAAQYELREAADVLAGLEDAEYEGFIPLAPFQASVVEQASLGSAPNWLDGVANDMHREAQATDYEQLLSEGPEAFIAELDNAPLADQGHTRQMAASFVRTKTAGVENAEHRDKYEAMFLARVEEVRRAELVSRKTTVHKEAAAERDEFASYPDEVLFS